MTADEGLGKLSWEHTFVIPQSESHISYIYMRPPPFLGKSNEGEIKPRARRTWAYSESKVWHFLDDVHFALQRDLH